MNQFSFGAFFAFEVSIHREQEEQREQVYGAPKTTMNTAFAVSTLPLRSRVVRLVVLACLVRCTRCCFRKCRTLTRVSLACLLCSFALRLCYRYCCCLGHAATHVSFHRCQRRRLARPATHRPRRKNPLTRLPELGVRRGVALACQRKAVASLFGVNFDQMQFICKFVLFAFCLVGLFFCWLVVCC